MIELALYWIYDLPVNRKLPVDPREEAKFMFGQSQGSVLILRKLSTSRVNPGSTFEVSITILADEDIEAVGLVELLPEGWQAQGDNSILILIPGCPTSTGMEWSSMKSRRSWQGGEPMLKSCGFPALYIRLRTLQLSNSSQCFIEINKRCFDLRSSECTKQ